MHNHKKIIIIRIIVIVKGIIALIIISKLLIEAE